MESSGFSLHRPDYKGTFLKAEGSRPEKVGGRWKLKARGLWPSVTIRSTSEEGLQQGARPETQALHPHMSK